MFKRSTLGPKPQLIPPNARGVLSDQVIGYVCLHDIEMVLYRVKMKCPRRPRRWPLGSETNLERNYEEDIWHRIRLRHRDAARKAIYVLGLPDAGGQPSGDASLYPIGRRSVPSAGHSASVETTSKAPQGQAAAWVWDTHMGLWEQMPERSLYHAWVAGPSRRS